MLGFATFGIDFEIGEPWECEGGHIGDASKIFIFAHKILVVFGIEDGPDGGKKGDTNGKLDLADIIFIDSLMLEILLDENKEIGFVVSDILFIHFFDSLWIIDGIFIVHKFSVEIVLWLLFGSGDLFECFGHGY